MSHAIRLVLVAPGENVVDSALRDDLSEAPHSSEAKARNDLIMRALAARYPAFRRFDSDRRVQAFRAISKRPWWRFWG